MKVAEYVAQLLALPQDAEVVRADPGCGCCADRNAFLPARDPQVTSPLVEDGEYNDPGEDGYEPTFAKYGFRGETLEAPFVVV